MKNLTALALLCLSFSRLLAQVNSEKNFLYLYSDSVIYGDRIIYESSFDGSSHFIVDFKRIHPEQVKFFQNDRGFFANTRHLVLNGRTSFSERIREGKINLFEGNFTGEPRYSHAFYAPHSYSKNEVTQANYYNIGFGDLRKANYENLTIDLAANQGSMNNLQQYRKATSVSRTLFVIGGAAVLGGLVSFVANGSRDVGKSSGFPAPGWSDRVSSPKLGLSLGLMLAGAGISGAGLLKSLTRAKYLKGAIDTYNYSR